jgi:hypothetical protein
MLPDMNKTFSINRFGRLFKKHTKEHYRNYLMSVAVLVGVMILGGSFLVYMTDIQLDKNFQTFFFFTIMLLSGTIFTSTVFTDLGERKKAVAWLVLPASHLEKYLVAWIYSFLLFIIVYTVIFYMALFTALNIQHVHTHRMVILNIFENQILLMYLVYAFLHSIAFFGAVYFEKLHFIKTGFAFFIIIAVLILLNKILLSIFLGRSVDASPPFSNMRFAENGQMVDIKIERQNAPYILYLFIILTFIFWVAAYFRLKEKQI